MLIGTHPAAARPVNVLDKNKEFALLDIIKKILPKLDNNIATRLNFLFPILSASNPIGIRSNNCAIA